MRIKSKEIEMNGSRAGGMIPGRLCSATLACSLLLVLAAGCHRNGAGREITGSGSIEVDEVQLSPLIPGRISSIAVDEGDRVKKGDLLATLVTDEMRAQVASTAAGRDAAARTVQQAEANARNARDELKRAEDLFRAGVVSRQDLERLRTRADVASSQLQAARSREQQLSAVVSQAKTKFDETSLRSPIDGIILSRNFLPGEVVMPGSAILSLADLKHVYLKIYIPETMLALVKYGQRARVNVDGVDKPILAKVVHVADHAEFTPKNVQTQEARTRLVFGVKLDIDNPEEILKPGMPADAVIETGSDSGK